MPKDGKDGMMSKKAKDDQLKGGGADVTVKEIDGLIDKMNSLNDAFGQEILTAALNWSI